jgi:hypothetical protein
MVNLLSLIVDKMTTSRKTTQPKDNRSTFDKIWDVHPESEAEDNAMPPSTALELLTAVDAPLYVLDDEEAASLKPGNKVQISPDPVSSKRSFVREANDFQEHFMSRFDSILILG